ncbi:MAG: hypothetical protein KDA75_17740 [Planctomycetaceae bacterium]|nr:hypothetical protein [Planctomycetaceae bacterium]
MTGRSQIAMCTTRWRAVRLLCSLVVLSSLTGCVRVLAIGAKVLIGDPKMESTFQQRTGIELQDGEHKVAVVIDAPHRVAYDFDTLVPDLQERLLQQMRRNGIEVVDPDEVTSVLENAGGDFSPTHLAQKIDADCILHVQIEAFTDAQSGNPSLLQSHSHGVVTGYEVRGEFGAAGRHVVEVYEESFQSSYPSGHPLAAEQTPRLKFQQRCINDLADEIGRQCYDVTTAELY